MTFVSKCAKLRALKKGASAGDSPQLRCNLRGVRGTCTGALTVGLTTLRAVLPKDRGCAASERGKSRCPRVQDEQDERGVGAPRPKRARSCSPPARLSCEQSVAMVRTAQDKPLRKVAWLVQQIDSVPARFALVLSSCWALLLVVFTATDHLCFIRAGSAFVGPFLG